MLNDAELIEQTEDHLSVVIQVAHQSGLNYWQILRIIVKKILPQLVLQAEAEYYLNLRD